MEKILVLDPSKCYGCRLCEVVCSLKKEGECNPTKSRISVVKIEMENVSTPVTCLHCEDAPCSKVCLTKAIAKDSTTGALVIDEQKCIGCRLCMYVCPISAPIYDSDKGKVVKCDLCNGEPVCVDFCTTQALRCVPADKLSAVQKRCKASEITEFQRLTSYVRKLASEQAGLSESSPNSEVAKNTS